MVFLSPIRSCSVPQETIWFVIDLSTTRNLLCVISLKTHTHRRPKHPIGTGTLTGEELSAFMIWLADLWKWLLFYMIGWFDKLSSLVPLFSYFSIMMKTLLYLYLNSGSTNLLRRNLSNINVIYCKPLTYNSNNGALHLVTQISRVSCQKGPICHA